MIDKATLADRLVDLWQPELENLEASYWREEGWIFAGLVNFCGLHLTLWPLWLAALKAKGIPLDGIKEYSGDDVGFQTLPWFALAYSAAPQATWVLVKGASLLDTNVGYNALMHKDVVLALSYLDHDGKVMFFGEARANFDRFGAFRGSEAPLHLPLVRCDELAQTWSHWQAAAKPLEEIIYEAVAVELSRTSEPKELRFAFHILAGQVWQKLLDKGVVHAGKPSSSILSRLGLRKTNPLFGGVLLLYGDHHLLWQQMQGTTITTDT